MRTRHRVPSIFNLSMVDVLCCALGCVILLWLVNLREAKRQTDEAGQAQDQLATTRGQLSESSARLAAAANERDALQYDLANARTEAGALRTTLAQTTQQVVASGHRLVAVSSQLQNALRQRDAASERTGGMEKALVAL